MYKFFLTMATVFFCSICFAQTTDSIYAEVQVRSFSYEGKQVKFDTPRVLKLHKIGCSDIISLGYANNKEIGLQIEMLKSSFGNDSTRVIGKAFFIKVDGNWKIGSIISYQEKDFIKISNWSQMNDKEYGIGTSSVNKFSGEFQADFGERYYILSKNK